MNSHTVSPTWAARSAVTRGGPGPNGSRFPSPGSSDDAEAPAGSHTSYRRPRYGHCKELPVNSEAGRTHQAHPGDCSHVGDPPCRRRGPAGRPGSDRFGRERKASGNPGAKTAQLCTVRLGAMSKVTTLGSTPGSTQQTRPLKSKTVPRGACPNAQSVRPARRGRPACRGAGGDRPPARYTVQGHTPLGQVGAGAPPSGALL